MDKDKFSGQTRKALKVYNVEWIVEPTLHPNYSLNAFGESHASPTGYLIIFEIRSIKADQPYFIGRWDEKADTVDVDIFDVDDTAKRLFNSEKDGYRGHRRHKMAGNERKFEIQIAISHALVCHGILRLNLVRGQTVGGELSFSRNCDSDKNLP